MGCGFLHQKACCDVIYSRFTPQERTNVHRTAFFLHTPDFSLSKVTALKVVWRKDTSKGSKEPEDIFQHETSGHHLQYLTMES